MIAYISGTLVEYSPDSLIIDVGGLGYRVHTTPTTVLSLKPGAPVTLFTCFVVRENLQALYGFSSREEADFFEMLISVSGIGPRSAIGILSLADVATLKSATASGDISYLTKVSGIGKKSAEKIVIELRDKIGSSETEASHETFKEDTDILDALKSLGYSTAEAREALKHIPEDVENSSERLKHALRALGT